MMSHKKVQIALVVVLALASLAVVVVAFAQESTPTTSWSCQGMMGGQAALCQQLMQRCAAGNGSCPRFEATPESTPASS